MKPKWSIAIRFAILVSLSLWVSLVCGNAYAAYQKEMNRPPDEYSDINSEAGLVELTEVVHATGTADKFFVIVTV
jgi:hypothetical protein